MNYADKEEKHFRRIFKCWQKERNKEELKLVNEDEFIIISLKRALQKCHEKYNSKKKLEYELSQYKYCK